MREKASRSQQLCGLQGGLAWAARRRGCPSFPGAVPFFKIQSKGRGSEGAGERAALLLSVLIRSGLRPWRPLAATFTRRNNFGYGSGREARTSRRLAVGKNSQCFLTALAERKHCAYVIIYFLPFFLFVMLISC